MNWTSANIVYHLATITPILTGRQDGVLGLLLLMPVPAQTSYLTDLESLVIALSPGTLITDRRSS